MNSQDRSGRALSPVWIALGIALLVTLWLASGLLGGDDPAGSDQTAAGTEPARQARKKVAVAVSRSRAEPVLQETEITARTAPMRAVDLRAETQGRVVSVAAREGQALAAGDLIVRLAQNDRAAQLSRAKALLEQRELQWQAAQKLSEKGYQTRAGVAEARANLESARAEVASIRDDLSKTRITAPFKGVLEQRAVEEGDLVRVGDTVGRLVQQSPFLVVGDVPEDVVARIDVGQKGSAKLVSGETVQGRVRYVAGEADNATRTYAVELEVDPEGARLIAGATAKLRIPLGEVTAHSVEPSVLTLNEAGDFGIKTIDEDNRVQFHKAEVVRDRDGRVWLSGLPEELRIITVGQGFVRDGDIVDPQEDEDDVKAAPAPTTSGSQTDA